MRPGDVWLVTLPISTGTEQHGQRPAIVMQDEEYGRGSPLVLVVPLTSQLGALRFPASIRIEPSTQNGLRTSSVAMVFQTRALDRSRFARELGRLSTSDLERVLAQLRRLVGL